MEKFLHAFTSRGFDSVSWSILLLVNQQSHCVPNLKQKILR